MMKRAFIIFSIILIPLVGCATFSATDLAPEDARISKVIETPERQKDILFVIANAWAVDNFVSANSVIEFSDKSAGIIKGKYVTSFTEGVYTFDLRSTLTIEVKDGASRITIADPYYKTTSGLGQRYYGMDYRQMRSAESFTKNCIPRYNDLIASFEKAMKEVKSGF